MMNQGFSPEQLKQLVEEARKKPDSSGCSCPRHPATSSRIAFDNECKVHGSKK